MAKSSEPSVLYPCRRLGEGYRCAGWDIWQKVDANERRYRWARANPNGGEFHHNTKAEAVAAARAKPLPEQL